MTDRVDVAKYLTGREFHWRNYNCFHFVRDVWLDLTGVDLGDLSPTEATPGSMQGAFTAGEEALLGANKVARIPRPVDPCIVLMLRPRVLNHVGIFTQRRVLHLAPRLQVRLEDFKLATMSFNEVRFYK